MSEALQPGEYERLIAEGYRAIGKPLPADAKDGLIPWVTDDGGFSISAHARHVRHANGVVIAIAIFCERSYDEVADVLQQMGSEANARRQWKNRKEYYSIHRHGVWADVIKRYMAEHATAVWTPTMTIGSGTTVHVRAHELPAGRLLLNVSRNLLAVIDGVAHAADDPRRDGFRAVYGYWRAS